MSRIWNAWSVLMGRTNCMAPADLWVAVFLKSHETHSFVDPAVADANDAVTAYRTMLDARPGWERQ